MFEVGFHARAWCILDSSSSLKSCILLSVVNLERGEVLIPILHIRSWKNVCIKQFLWSWEHLSKNILWVAVDWGDSSEVTSCLHDPDFFIAVLGVVRGETKQSFPSQMEAIRRQLHVQNTYVRKYVLSAVLLVCHLGVDYQQHKGQMGWNELQLQQGSSLSWLNICITWKIIPKH